MKFETRKYRAEIKALVDLKCQGAAQLGIGKVNRSFTKKQIEGIFQKTKVLSEPIVETLTIRGEYSGVLFLYKSEAFFDKKETSVIWLFAYKSRSSKACAWMKQMLNKHKKFIKKGAMLEFYSNQKDMVRFSIRKGMMLDSVKLFGDVETSIKVLKREIKRKKLSWPKNLELRPLEEKTQITKMLHIMKEEFTKRPQHFWAGSRPAILKAHRKTFNEILSGKEKDTSVWLVYRGRKLVGYFDYRDIKKSFYGRVAGLEFMLHEDLQGVGLGYFAYLTMLQDMKKKRIKMFHGNTSNPGVLNLARKMKRKPFSYFMRYDKSHYHLSHFKPFI